VSTIEYRLPGEHTPHEHDAVATRLALLAATTSGPKPGDWVTFADGRLCRVAILWRGDQVQAIRSGEFYLSETGEVDCLGSYIAPVPVLSLAVTGRTREADFWLTSLSSRAPGDQLRVYVEVSMWTCPMETPSW
jgi:hypothetical protein